MRASRVRIPKLTMLWPLPDPVDTGSDKVVELRADGTFEVASSRKDPESGKEVRFIINQAAYHFALT